MEIAGKKLIKSTIKCDKEVEEVMADLLKVCNKKDDLYKVKSFIKLYAHFQLFFGEKSNKHYNNPNASRKTSSSILYFFLYIFSIEKRLF